MTASLWIRRFGSALRRFDETTFLCRVPSLPLWHDRAMVSRRALLAAGLAAGAVTPGGCAPDRSEHPRGLSHDATYHAPPARRLAAGTDARIVDVLTRYHWPHCG